MLTLNLYASTSEPLHIIIVIIIVVAIVRLLGGDLELRIVQRTQHTEPTVRKVIKCGLHRQTVLHDDEIWMR